MELEVERWGECEQSNTLANEETEDTSSGQEEQDRHMERNRNRRDPEALGERAAFPYVFKCDLQILTGSLKLI